MSTLTSFNSAQLELLHRGKVRDSIRVDEQTRLIVVSDRISAFNKKIKTPIPNKGALLNGIANFWFSKTTHIIPNHIIKQVAPNATLVKEAEPIRIEMVVRGYLSGSMWRAYQKGKRTFSGVTLEDGLTQNHKFELPILTPTTKDEFDTEITEDYILKSDLITKDGWMKMKIAALALFDFGTQYLAQKGIILVDTKYEFGWLDGELILIDEMHTPDSSRFWKSEDYQNDVTKVEQIDKEFVRLWLLEEADEHGEVPVHLSEEVTKETSQRYQEIYELITGQTFVPSNLPAYQDLYFNLVRNGVIQSGVVALVADSMACLSFSEAISQELEALGLTVHTHALSTRHYAASVVHLATIYNDCIEPALALVISSDENNLSEVLNDNLEIPVLEVDMEAESELDDVVADVLCYINLPHLKIQ